MDVDVVTGRVVLDVLDQGSVNVLRAAAERGSTRGSAETCIEEGDDDRSVDVSAAFVDMRSKGWRGQARDGDFPAHLVVSGIQSDPGDSAPMAAQDGRKWVTAVERIGKSLGGHPCRNERRPDNQQHDDNQLPHTVTSRETASTLP